ncbi:glycosyltransferase family 2 protein [Chryseobacterium piperi]|uniref:glycosyltransferase family 2 protein n=1 Tax=Chryseobacterium piperi TaxID=558152 RepID=UPI000A9FD9C1|nr:glycosyltransferase [Chryseobacterium piperi]
MKKDFLVTVSMPNYGQEKFISEAILGVLSQKANFEIELIVTDDCSPDNTKDVVQNIIETHPNGHWIKYIRHTKNKGAIPNFAWTISQAKGKYIAVCEGDDYWTNPLKLQKQVDFLEQNPTYSITFHKVQETGGSENEIISSPSKEETYTILDLAKGNFIHTPSVVFRKNFEELPEWFKYSPIGDYPLHLLNAAYGLIKYFPDEMAVYRVGSGIWSSKSTVYKLINTIFSLKFLLEYFKENKPVFESLKKQYDNYYAAIIKPIEAKEILESNIKDYRFLEKIISFSSILKILKIKLCKKIGIANSR